MALISIIDSYEDDPDAPGERRLCSSTILPPLQISVTEEELRLFRCVFLYGHCFLRLLVLPTLSWMPFLSSYFLLVESQTLTLSEASEACISLTVCLDSFVTSWMTRQSTMRGILEGRPLLGSFTTAPSFFARPWFAGVPEP